MTPITTAEIVADFRAAGRPVALGDNETWIAVCPACKDRQLTIGPGDAIDCPNGCDRGRIATELAEARRAIGTLTREHGAGDRSVDGARFILDAPDTTPAVWGAGDEVLWASGEPCMLYAPQGVGKSTVSQQLILASIGIGGREVLGWPVQDDGQPVLLIAADRPTQIARSLRRMVTATDRATLESRLIVWRGPLPFNITDDPQELAAFAVHHGAGKVVIDSMKDVAIGLTDDVTGAAVNQALQHLVASGTEVLTLHHPRKSNAQNPRPRTIDDVYGSTWLTAGHGSVLLLWGKPGDLVVELEHIKQPAGDVGRIKLIHDHDAGRTIRYKTVPLLELMASAVDGLTVRDAAVALFGDSPEDNDLEKARRKLRALVDRGDVEAREPGGPRVPARYYPTSRGLRGHTVGSCVGSIASPRTAHESAHADPTQPTRSPSDPVSPLKGDGGMGVGHATDQELDHADRLLNHHPEAA